MRCDFLGIRSPMHYTIMRPFHWILVYKSIQEAIRFANSFGSDILRRHKTALNNIAYMNHEYDLDLYRYAICLHKLKNTNAFLTLKSCVGISAMSMPIQNINYSAKYVILARRYSVRQCRCYQECLNDIIYNYIYIDLWSKQLFQSA